MIWEPGNAAFVKAAPDPRFEIRPLSYSEIDQWCETHKELSLTPWTREQFLEKMLFDSPLTISVKNIFCVFDRESGEMAATASACLDGTKRIGNLHRVAAKANYQGLGLGKAVCSEVIGCFIENGCTFADLVTDDFRIPAIVIYLKLGFKPFLYADGMEERWRAIFKLIDPKYITWVYGPEMQRMELSL